MHIDTCFEPLVTTSVFSDSKYMEGSNKGSIKERNLDTFSFTIAQCENLSKTQVIVLREEAHR